MFSRKYFFINLFFYALWSLSASACVRTDIADRSPTQVVKNSLNLAQKEHHFGHVTGLVLVRTVDDVRSPGWGFEKYGSGIALDDQTVLTAAHFIEEFKDSLGELLFTLHPDPFNPKNTEAPLYYETDVFMSSSFENAQTKEHNVNLLLQFPNILMNGKIIGEWTYPELDREDLSTLRGFLGEDLAILKLKSPLPRGLTYPEIYPHDCDINDTYGISLGYGRMYYNDGQKGPVRVESDNSQSIKRHLMSAKLFSLNSKNQGPLLYANYKSYLLSDKLSYIPQPNMLKTEGTTVPGDSGGPLFIKHNGCYKLAGINSYAYKLVV